MAIKYHTDLLVIGGGINGCGIAADAASRGLSVTLCEKGDLASGTSSSSSKLIHGGIRYLEQNDFKLVREALKERLILLRRAPHLVQPLEFILPHEKHLRPQWLIGLGLFFYDHLAKRGPIPLSKKVNIRKKPSPLENNYKHGFSYFDCFTDDARLVILNAIAAKQADANILTHTECLEIKRTENSWIATCQSKKFNGQKIVIHAKAVVNAAGPWLNKMSASIAHFKSRHTIKNVKGSHIVIPSLYAEKNAYILQNKDKRVIFTIPFRNDFTLVGTTDILYNDNPDKAHINITEIDYLCNAVNHYFKKKINPADILWSYTGVRPLLDDRHDNPSKVTRDAYIQLDDDHETLPLITIYGGKLTTYRRLAEHAVDKLKPYFNDMRKCTTKHTPLPGGDMGHHQWSKFTNELQQQYPELPKQMLQRYANYYGTLSHLILENKQSRKDLGRHFGADLYECEVDYWLKHEWANSIDDMLWRRSKLGLVLSKENKERLQRYLSRNAVLVD
ncbi:MAG: glycerol-3-phosphate dehydrogenase [Gammaproteobacteria bacterium]|nr:glycerol-3-phosphate dehydrogenase [Gammaproteobacteria bacterium]